MAEEIIHRFAKNSNDDVVFRVYEFKGKTYFDIRIYTTLPGEIDKVPTKKGISLRLEKIEDMKTGLKGLEEAIGKLQG